MANIKKLPLFVRCVIQNFPFIEEDFDALTNYQLISKVVEYLNKVISSQNEVIDETNALSAAFQQLHDYVENYFDNLDVQEEINNKLDAMVEAGTLQEIITAYIQANTAWCFDTVADMKNNFNIVYHNQILTNIQETFNLSKDIRVYNIVDFIFECFTGHVLNIRNIVLNIVRACFCADISLFANLTKVGE